MKRKIGRIFLLLFVIGMIGNLIPTSADHVYAATGGKTKEQAVAWAQNHATQKSSLDYDGAYGAQCVDLIKYYYVYLGNSAVSGNGKDYATNTLPNGWSRIRYYSGFVPQPGDVAVWTTGGGGAGHVAIVTSANATTMSVVEQNWDGKYCSSRSGAATSGIWGVIRPDFKQTNLPVGMVDGISTDYNTVTVSGWAYDRDNTSRSVEIHVYINSTCIGTGVANLYRPDVNSNASHQGVGNYHGYEIKCNVPENLTGTQTVTVFAIDAETGNNPSLNSNINMTVNIPLDNKAPTISNVTITNIDATGYTVQCTVTDNVAVNRVQFPTWTANNGQDDIQADWTVSNAAKGTKNGNVWTYRVNISDHKNEKAGYTTHIYAYDNCGNVSMANAGNDICVRYTISYDANGGSGAPSKQTKTHGTNLTLSSTVPTRFGYNFVGWSKSSSSTTAEYQPGDTYSANAPIILYAVWQQADISMGRITSNATTNITFPGRGVYYKFTPNMTTYYCFRSTGSLDTKMYLYDASGNQIAVNDDGGKDSNFQLTHQLTAGTTYYIYACLYNSSSIGSFTTEIHKGCIVNYDTNGGNEEFEPEYYYVYYYNTNNDWSNIQSPTRSGYQFVGWNTARDGSGKTYDLKNIDVSFVLALNKNETITLYAIWEPIDLTYTISYHANGGSGAPSNQTKTHGTNIALSTTKPVRFGYNFLGWSTSSTATSASYQPGANFTTDANTTLYAVWESASTISSGVTNSEYSAGISYSNQEKYYSFTPAFSGKVRFESTGNSDTQIYLYNSSGTQLDSDDDDGAGNNFLLTYAVSANTKYYVKVKYYSSGTGTLNFDVKRVYDITYHANGGTGVPLTQEKVHGTALTLSTTRPTRSGYSFLGWSTSSTATSASYQAGGSYTNDTAATLYAVWQHGCANGHNYVYGLTNSPTISATGKLSGTCSKCNGTVIVTLPKLNTTDYAYKEMTAATCTTDGAGRYTWKTTSYGSYYFDTVIQKTGHMYKSKVIEPTCKDGGYTTHTCSSCGDSYIDNEVKALGHNYVNAVCTVCGSKNPNNSQEIYDTFKDISRGEWYVSAVQYVYEHGLMSGNNGLFNPSGNVTRAQMVTTLYNIQGKPAVTDFRACQELVDVEYGEWYTNAVCWAYNTGVASGNDVTKMFNMNTPVTRQQLATFFYNYAEYKNLDIKVSADISDMKNSDQVASYAQKAIRWAVGTRIITGSEILDSTGNKVYDLKPTGTATRAQLASILQRFCENNNL